MAPRKLDVTQFKRRTLLVGESGAGKTHFIKSIQGIPELSDVLVIPLDSGQNTLAGSDVLIDDAKTLAEAEKIIWAIKQGKEEYKTVKTVVADGLSEVMKRTLADIAEKQAAATVDAKKPRDRDTNQVQDHLLKNNQVMRILRMLRDLPVPLVVVTCWPKKHYPMMIDDKGKETPNTQLPPTEITPDFSKSMLDTVVGSFDDSWFIVNDKVKGRRLLYTGDFEAYRAKTRSAEFAAQLTTKSGDKTFPVLVDPTFKDVYDAYFRAFKR